MVAIHVDDNLYAGTTSLTKVVVEALGDSLSTKNLSDVRFFIYSRSRDSIFVAPARSLLPLPTIIGP